MSEREALVARLRELDIGHWRTEICVAFPEHTEQINLLCDLAIAALSAPQQEPSGVREGMLRAAEIVKKAIKTCEANSSVYMQSGNEASCLEWQTARSAMRVVVDNITRAAEQVDAVLKVCKLGCTVNCGNCNSYAPLPQPVDGVVVPMEPTYAMLCALSGEWHSDKFGNARERYAALLAAAKEQK